MSHPLDWRCFPARSHPPGRPARLKDTVVLDSVQDDLASVVTKALEPAHVSVWSSERK
jgi:hypothetical protein